MKNHIDGTPWDKCAIEVIRTYAPQNGEYEVAYSGGKDSDVILDLTKRAGVPFRARYNFSPIDPPEVRRHVKELMRDPANRLTMRLPEQSLISVARKRGMMPTRTRRWCCQLIKERETDASVTMTGVRWAESSHRGNRRQFEACRRHGGFFLHPIINWSTSEVWAYIRERGLSYCSLYDEGWKRCGCVLCPFTRNTAKEMARWPGITRVWRRINDACFAVCVEKGNKTFATADEQWAWWLDRDAAPITDEDCPLFDEGLEFNDA